MQFTQIDTPSTHDSPDPPLPDWASKPRDHQVPAIEQIVDAFERDVRLVILDAPVGSGKTYVAERVRREINPGDTGKRSLYICSDKALQDQVENDFPYANVLKGRANYETQHGVTETAEDCTGGSAEDICLLCNSHYECPYQIAKQRAIEGPLSVTNTAMFLTAANAGGFLGAPIRSGNPPRNGLVIADECDMLEGALLGHCEYVVPSWVLRETGLSVPKKSVRKPTLIAFLDDVVEQMTAVLRKNRHWTAKQQRRARGFIFETHRTRDFLAEDLERDGDAEDSGVWFRDYDDDRVPFKLRPVLVSSYGHRYLWRHADRWLLMSGTVVSAPEMVESLGWDVERDGQWELVSVPNTFDVENRAIKLGPVASLKRGSGPEDYDAIAYAIEQICAATAGRALVHTVSYHLARELVSRVRANTPGGKPRVNYTHTSSQEKQGAVDRWLQDRNGIMFSPSMSRGVDLAGDMCRINIIAKCPFPSLGDKQVSRRLYLPGGQAWYATKTVRDIVQMTGRAVRHERDWMECWILDRQFVTNVWSRNKGLFTEQVREAVRGGLDVRWLMKPRQPSNKNSGAIER